MKPINRLAVGTTLGLALLTTAFAQGRPGGRAPVARRTIPDCS